MLTIRFARHGKKNQPFFRIIVLEKTKDPWGNFLEDLGYYNPLTKKMSLKKERIEHWISKGAQPSGSVHNLLVNQGIIKGKKVKVTKTGREETRKTEPTETLVAESAGSVGDKSQAEKKGEESKE